MPNKKAKVKKRKRRKLAVENKTRKRLMKKLQKEKKDE